MVPSTPFATDACQPQYDIPPPLAMCGTSFASSSVKSMRPSAIRGTHSGGGGRGGRGGGGGTGQGGQCFTGGLSHCPAAGSLRQNVCPWWLAHGCGVVEHGGPQHSRLSWWQGALPGRQFPPRTSTSWPPAAAAAASADGQTMSAAAITVSSKYMLGAPAMSLALAATSNEYNKLLA